MKILLIGNLGYIGSALQPYLESQGHEVHGMDIGRFNNNQVDQPPMDFNYYGPSAVRNYDAVILLAGNSSVAMCNDIYDTLEQNVFYPTRLAQYIKPHQKFIYISSASVYGANHSPYLSTESDSLPKPCNYYDMSKQMFDQIMQESNLDYYGLRLATVNGWSPNIRIDLMANAMAYSAVTEGKVKIANPKVPRSVLDITDLCRAVQAILIGPKKPGIYNLASFFSTVEEIGQYIAGYFNVEIDYLPHSPTYMFRLDTSKFQFDFDFAFKGSLDSIACTLKHNSAKLSEIGCLGLQDNYKRLAK